MNTIFFNCSNEAQAEPEQIYDGNWTGITSQESEIYFVAADNSITSIESTHIINCYDGSTNEGSFTINLYDSPLKIDEISFSISFENERPIVGNRTLYISGTFVSNSTCSGLIEVNEDICGNVDINWDANIQDQY